MEKIRDLIFLLSGFFIPVDIYVIGNWMGAGVQFALFRIQMGFDRWSYISLFRDVEFVFRGTLGVRTRVAVLLWAVSVLILAFAAFLYLFREDIWKPENETQVSSEKFIGLSILGSAVLFLCSMVAQYGPLFHGASGFAIPLGIPVMMCTGYYMHRRFSRAVQLLPGTKVPYLPLWKHQLTISRVTYAIICFLTMFFMLNFILYVYPTSGGDFAVYCSAVELWGHQENPYSMEKITRILPHYTNIVQPYPGSYYYPPATLLIFAPICDAWHLIYPFKIYFPLYLVVFLMGCTVASRFLLPEKDRLLLYTLLTSGFTSLFWSFSTGNMSILYILLTSLVFYFLIKKQYLGSSLCMGLVSIFTIFPIIFSSLYVFVEGSRREKLMLIASSTVVLVISLGISYLAYPAFFNSYVNQFLGENNPLLERGESRTPTAYLFFEDLAGLFLGKDTAFPYALDLFFICAVLILFFSFYRKNPRDQLKLFSFGLITIFLLIPRLKPNYFIFILVPVYLLIIHERDMIKALLVTLGAVIPSLCLVLLYYMQLGNFVGDLITLVISYNQLLCASAVFITIAWLHTRTETGRDLTEG